MKPAPPVITMVRLKFISVELGSIAILCLIQDLADAFLKGVSPVWDAQSECFLDFGLVKNRISRSFHFARKLIAMAWSYVALGISSICSNHFCENYLKGVFVCNC